MSGQDVIFVLFYQHLPFLYGVVLEGVGCMRRNGFGHNQSHK